MAKFKIIMTGPGVGTVYKDCEELTGVVAVKFCGDARNHLNTVEITYTADEVEIDAEADEING
jgi:hypothetical protein